MQAITIHRSILLFILVSSFWAWDGLSSSSFFFRCVLAHVWCGSISSHLRSNYSICVTQFFVLSDTNQAIEKYHWIHFYSCSCDDTLVLVYECMIIVSTVYLTECYAVYISNDSTTQRHK